METRTTQDLLAERRANIQEARQHPGHRLMIDQHIATIDAELGQRRRDSSRPAGAQYWAVQS